MVTVEYGRLWVALENAAKMVMIVIVAFMYDSNNNNNNNIEMCVVFTESHRNWLGVENVGYFDMRIVRGRIAYRERMRRP